MHTSVQGCVCLLSGWDQQAELARFRGRRRQHSHVTSVLLMQAGFACLVITLSDLFCLWAACCWVMWVCPRGYEAIRGLPCAHPVHGAAGSLPSVQAAIHAPPLSMGQSGLHHSRITVFMQAPSAACRHLPPHQLHWGRLPCGELPH